MCPGGLLPGSILLGNGTHQGSTSCGVLPGEKFLFCWKHSSGLLALIREREEDIKNQWRQKSSFLVLRKPLGRLCEFLRKQVLASLSWGLQRCHMSWVCKKAKACDHGLYRCFFTLAETKQNKEAASPMRDPFSHHLVYIFKEYNQQDPQPWQWRKAPPSNKQNQNNTKQNFFFVFLWAGIKKGKEFISGSQN